MRNLRQQVFPYRMGVSEILLYGCEGVIIVSVFGYFFYRSVVITILGMPFVLLLLRKKSFELYKKRMYELQIQFKETLVSVSGSLRAGYSLENAFLEAEKDMLMFYGRKSAIVSELSTVRLGLKNGISLVSLISDIGKRSGIQDIKDFAAVLVIGKQSGGNLGEIMDSFVALTEEKVQVLQEIQTIISSKKFEQKIMNCIPFFIIFYIESANKGFFEVLYNSIFGRIMMTGCLLVYCISIIISERITNIQI